MSHTCRGTINLAGAFIVTEESTNFTVSNGGTQTFHLKANHEVERQRLITCFFSILFVEILKLFQMEAYILYFIFRF